MNKLLVWIVCGFAVLALTACMGQDDAAKDKADAGKGGAAASKDAGKEVAVSDKEVGKIFSYIWGYNVASSAKQQGISFTKEKFDQGVQDSLDGKQSRYSDEQIQKAYATVNEKAAAKRAEEQKAIAAQAAANKAENAKFFAANAKKAGVITTKSGLQYKSLQKNKLRKRSKPTVNDKVKVHYRGTLLDGTEFDSSYKRNKPVEFPVTGVIKGWTEVLQLMRPGDKFEVYVPSDLAYGDAGAGQLIKPGSALVFTIELLKVIPKDKK